MAGFLIGCGVVLLLLLMILGGGAMAFFGLYLAVTATGQEHAQLWLGVLMCVVGLIIGLAGLALAGLR